jgi:large subunit ribosomal protein L25
MPATGATTLDVALREPSSSRAVRRLRRAGDVPGVVYGGGKDPQSFSVHARDLRHALSNAGAVLDLRIDGLRGTPVVVKELARHPVTGDTLHLDLLRVRLDQPIQASVVLELVGGEDAPGVKDGGVLEQITREVTVEALPTDIPDSLAHDVSAMEVAGTLLLQALTAPAGVTIVGDPDAVVATITAPRLQVEPATEIEEETEVVGEASAADGESEDAEPGAGDASGDAGSE